MRLCVKVKNTRLQVLIACQISPPSLSVHSGLMVFEGSVKGLNVGSSVMFRGVKIGAVTSIRMRADYATKAMTILVYADSEPSIVEIVNMDEATAKAFTRQDRYANMKQLIARGLRAQLEMQSIVTGQLISP